MNEDVFPSVKGGFPASQVSCSGRFPCKERLSNPTPRAAVNGDQSSDDVRNASPKRMMG